MSVFSLIPGKGDEPFRLQSPGSIFSPAEIDLLRGAQAFCEPFYMDKSLPNGELLSSHLDGVAGILAGLRVDSDTLAAGVLHSVPGYLEGYEEELATAFGPTVAHLVEGVRRVGRIQVLRSASSTDNIGNGSAQIEALRKMLLAMAEDIRVVIIALADRLQTMRYVAASNIAGRWEAAEVTLNIFAPLANRLGLWQVKWELEDLSFRITEPERYKKIATLLEETRRSREQYIALVVDKLQSELHQAGIKAQITGRPKHIYSIYRKMKRKGLDFKEIQDTRAVRILVLSPRRR